MALHHEFTPKDVDAHEDSAPVPSHLPAVEAQAPGPPAALAGNGLIPETLRRREGMAAPVKDVQSADGVTIVSLAGDVNSLNVPTLHAALVAAANERPRCLVVDLLEVSYIDSAGVGTLIEILRRVRAYQGKMMLCGVVGQVRSVIEITKIDRLFTICDNAEQAVLI